MSKSRSVYCGAQPLKKGQKYGSMKDCVGLNQIRLYGLKKIDSKTLQDKEKGTKKINELKKKKLLLHAQNGSLSGKLSKLNREYKEAGPNRRKEIKDEFSKLAEEQKKVIVEIKALEKQIPLPKGVRPDDDEERPKVKSSFKQAVQSKQSYIDIEKLRSEVEKDKADYNKLMDRYNKLLAQYKK